MNSRRETKLREKGQVSYSKLLTCYILFRRDNIALHSIPSEEDVSLMDEQCIKLLCAYAWRDRLCTVSISQSLDDVDDLFGVAIVVFEGYVRPVHQC